MGVHKDLFVSYSCLTQELVEAFCQEWGIDSKFNLHFEFSNLHHPFSTFVLYILEYYLVSFCQIYPQGLTRVLLFEVLCRALGYDRSLLLFRRFFRLAKNGDWFTFETSQVDVCLISTMVTTLGSWKYQFFWVTLFIERNRLLISPSRPIF
ncbi:hypothetical protein Hanom_Chr04g00371921 [Helianthus anomalus]